ncbi:MAG: nitroreductase family protein [Eubacterium sp.]
MDFLELAEARYSCRKISDRPVEQEKIEKILKAAQLSPSAHNNQAYRIWVIKTPDEAAKVAEATQCTFGAPLFFVVGTAENEGWVRPADGRNFADVDCTIAATHMMLEIEDLGLATTWVGWFDPAVMKKNFPDMEGSDLLAIFPTGYAKEEAKPSRKHSDRRPLEDTAKYY